MTTVHGCQHLLVSSMGDLSRISYYCSVDKEYRFVVFCLDCNCVVALTLEEYRQRKEVERKVEEIATLGGV